MKRLIVDVSPIFYSNLISSVGEAKREGVKKVDGVIEFNKSVLIFKIFEELAKLKNTYNVQEVILAFDNPKGGYWRKNYYDRYKYGRKEAREKSEIDWSAGFKVFDEVTEILEKFTSFSCVSVPTLEADDIAFVLSEQFSKQGDETVLFTIDQDWIHALNYPNVSVFRSRKTQRLEPLHEVKTEQELKDKIEEHCVFGDKGDGFLHIKSWTKFSDEFIADYPNFKGREQELYSKHHKIEAMYNEKHNWEKKAYKHPRFGWKSFKKSSTTLEEILKENPIHQKNYDMNKKLCLPMYVPTDLANLIKENYDQTSKAASYPELQKFFLQNNLFELNGNISNF